MHGERIQVVHSLHRAASDDLFDHGDGFGAVPGRVALGEQVAFVLGNMHRDRSPALLGKTLFGRIDEPFPPLGRFILAVNRCGQRHVFFSGASAFRAAAAVLIGVGEIVRLVALLAGFTLENTYHVGLTYRHNRRSFWCKFLNFVTAFSLR
ncbi:MAG TPA: hypothetical protein VL096_03460 [Pirellulaceae bacterium]|nr:hypothetical protein [Pirellulaceae bacterium]